jgi:hypothetical protein
VHQQKRLAVSVYLVVEPFISNNGILSAFTEDRPVGITGGHFVFWGIGFMIVSMLLRPGGGARGDIGMVIRHGDGLKFTDMDAPCNCYCYEGGGG